MSPEALKLKKLHDDFVTRHSSPMREKFVYEFGRNCAGPASWMPVPPVMKEQPPSPSLRTIDPSQRFESTNQSHYMPYTEALKIPSFRPEVKHRNLKTESHEHTEAMFKEWNVHGKGGR